VLHPFSCNTSETIAASNGTWVLSPGKPIAASEIVFIPIEASSDSQQRTARWRAQGAGVELGEAQTAIADPLHVRDLDEATEHVPRGEADVVPQQVDDVRRTLRRRYLDVSAPILLLVARVDGSNALKWLRHFRLQLEPASSMCDYPPTSPSPVSARRRL